MRQRDLVDKRVVCYDLETTGFSPETSSQAIQVATMTIVNNEVVDRQQWFVACPTPLPEKIVELTGITDQDLVGGATLYETAQRLLAVFQPGPDLVLVGHNILGFDNRFVACLWRSQLDHHYDLAPHCYDTLAWTRADRHNLFVPSIPNCAWQKSILLHRLSGPKCDLRSACEYYGVEANGFHQAHNDVEAAWGIAQVQMQRREVVPAPCLGERT